MQSVILLFQVIPFKVGIIIFNWRSFSTPTGAKAKTAAAAAAGANSSSFSNVTKGFETADLVRYSIHVIHSSGPAMDPPKLNVSATGAVPSGRWGGRFAVTLPCTGRATAEIDFLIEVGLDRKSPKRGSERDRKLVMAALNIVWLTSETNASELLKRRLSQKETSII
jgi:hypothetical protein